MIEINISNNYSSTIELNDELINQGSLRANEFFITAEFASTYEELTRYVCTFNFRRNDNVEINGLVATPVMRNSKWGWYYNISSKDITALDGDLHLTIKLNNLNEDEVITTTSFTLHVEHNAIGEEQVLINDAQYNALLDKFNLYLTKDAVDFTDKEVNINIDGSPKGVYANLSALQTAYPSGSSGVYLTSDNGHWYWWNGSAWTDGGVYQSSEDIEQIKKDAEQLKEDLDNINSLVNEKTIQLELIDGAVYWETGVITNEFGSKFKRTNYINIHGVKSIENNVYGYGTVGTAIYDSNKTYLTGKKNGIDITTLPENAHYIIFTVGNNLFEQTVKLHFKSELIDTVNNYKKRIDEEKYVHFSVDDCTFWTDLIDNENTYESPFENSFLAEVKANHDKYGSTWSLFCFNQIGGYDISNVPSKFADYFKAESSWLKFQYHSENYDTLWDIDNVEEIKTSYNKCINALYKMTGTTDCIDSVTRLQSYKGSRNNMIAIRDCNCGIKGVLSPDVPNVYPYWDESDGTIMNFMSKHDIYHDSSMQMVMVKSQKRIEASSFDVTVFNTIEYANFKPMLELMTHYTSSEWNATKKKLDTICQWLKENGYVYGFSKDVFKL